jgi:hypothetical protein
MAATRLFTKSAIRPVDVLVKLHKFKLRPQDKRFRAPIHNSGFCSMVKSKCFSASAQFQNPAVQPANHACDKQGQQF